MNIRCNIVFGCDGRLAKALWDIIERMLRRELSLPTGQTLFVVGILFSRCPSVHVCVHASVRNVLFP